MGSFAPTMTGGRWRVVLTRLGGASREAVARCTASVGMASSHNARARVRGWRRLALLASLGQLHLSSAQTVPSLTVPSLTVPTLSTPVTTPAVSTPTVTTPIVTVPKVTVPTVTVPPVTVPKVTVPKSPTPTVSVPRATSPVHVPTVQTRPRGALGLLPVGGIVEPRRPGGVGSRLSAGQPAGGSATAATAGGDGASASGSYVAGPSRSCGTETRTQEPGAGLEASRAARHRGPLSTKALRRLVSQLRGASRRSRQGRRRSWSCAPGSGCTTASAARRSRRSWASAPRRRPGSNRPPG